MDHGLLQKDFLAIMYLSANKAGSFQKERMQMQFNSYTFILAFLPVLIIGYFAFSKLHATAGKLFMVMASVYFYVYGSREISFIFAVSIIVNLSFSFIISRIIKYKKIILICDILANTGLLLYFKYLRLLA